MGEEEWWGVENDCCCCCCWWEEEKGDGEAGEGEGGCSRLGLFCCCCCGCWLVGEAPLWMWVGSWGCWEEEEVALAAAEGESGVGEGLRVVWGRGALLLACRGRQEIGCGVILEPMSDIGNAGDKYVTDV